MMADGRWKNHAGLVPGVDIDMDAARERLGLPRVQPLEAGSESTSYLEELQTGLTRYGLTVRARGPRTQ